jgi:hypothetical protein
LVRVAAILYRERVKVELFGQLCEILARRVCDIGPNDILLSQAEVADIRRRNVLLKRLGRTVQTDSFNQAGLPSLSSRRK